jgi:hypothetical protein
MHILLLLVLLVGQEERTSQIYIVANEGVTLTPTEVRDLYVGEKQFSNGLRLLPVDNLGAQGLFVSKALAMNLQRYETLWIKKSFRDALNPPMVKATDAEVLAFVERTRGAVGYVSTLPTGAHVTVVGRF